MSAFEYLLIPIAIVIGFAITQLLTSWARIVRDRGRQKQVLMYLSTSGWMLMSLLVHFSGLWAYREIDLGTPGPLALGYLILIITPTLSFSIAVSVLVPSETKPDLAAHYYAVAKPFFLINALGMLLSAAPDFLPGVTIKSDLVALSTYVGIVVVTALSHNRIVHYVCHGLLWLFIAATVFASVVT